MAETDTIFGIPTNYFGAAGATAGAGADIYSFLRNEQQRRQVQKLYDILSNPQKLAAYVQGWYQPMSAAENQAVQRDLGANWATMTGGAPGGAMNQYIADALAKIESQRYQTAGNQSIQALQAAMGATPATMKGGYLGDVLKSLAVLKQIRGQQPPSQTPPGIAYTPGGGNIQETDMANPTPPPTTDQYMPGVA